jgi:hypothetical protein
VYVFPVLDAAVLAAVQLALAVQMPRQITTQMKEQ